ncbi:MAG: acyl-CoA desaturase [Verrucomicrobiales bacterium]|nr:acyl-CoA desaturase [Verrucomicrobiales bacterium]MCP5560474.1 acyl-CoA desaturase [Verrucomicrobiaceae bacterium]
MTVKNGASWVPLMVAAVYYSLTVWGIGLGFHRLFTHRAFRANRVIEFGLAFLGSMSAQGSVLRWCAVHRRHHQYSDHDGDPHSPHTEGEGVKGLLKGMWHSHMGWLFRENPPALDKAVADLAKDKMVMWVDRMFPAITLFSLFSPALVGWLLTGTWEGTLATWIWAGPIRIFLFHHVTWSVNSVCHLWGARPFKTKDQSRNHPIVALLSFGEGWHNNHHAFPNSARCGMAWWEIDISYMLLWTWEKLGLAWDLHLPEAALAERRRN